LSGAIQARRPHADATIHTVMRVSNLLLKVEK
jgi:hypothetical protein